MPGLAVAQDQSAYFDWHHTHGDTLDKVDPLELGLAAAAFASLTWSLADSPERLPGPPRAAPSASPPPPPALPAEGGEKSLQVASSVQIQTRGRVRARVRVRVRVGPAVSG